MTDLRGRLRTWRIENWSVGWKVAAAVAVPLIAALVLGGLRVGADRSEASAQGAVSERMSLIPKVVTIEAASGRMALAKISNSAPLIGQMDAEGDAAIAGLRDASAGFDDPAVKPQIDALIQTTQALRNARGGTETRSMVELRNQATEKAIAITRELVSTVDTGRLQEIKSQMIQTWQAKSYPFAWGLAVTPLVVNPRAAVPDAAATANAAELAVLGSMEQNNPAAAADVATLRSWVARRTELLEQGRAAGTSPVGTVGQTLIDTSNKYVDMLSAQSEAINAEAQARADDARGEATRSLLLLAIALLVTIVLGFFVARSLVGPIRRLQRNTQDVAENRLGDQIARIDRGAGIESLEIEPLSAGTSEEVGQLGDAVDALHLRALSLAGGQAELRRQINDMFETMARRNKSLVDRQLGLIEALEFEEKDPQRLESLFALDHLAARMRRNSDNLLVLSGTKARGGPGGDIQIRDILRAAASEVEDYRRIKTGATPDGTIIGAAATDVVHLLAELLENALASSPPDTDVSMLYSPSEDDGLLIEIVDAGIGIPAPQLAAINARLASRDTVTPETTRRMGLFVVARLAARHGIVVRLRRTYTSGSHPGTTASVHLHKALISGPIVDRNRQPADPPTVVLSAAELPRRTPGTHRSAATVGPGRTPARLPQAPAPVDARSGESDAPASGPLRTDASGPLRTELPGPGADAPGPLPRRATAGAPSEDALGPLPRRAPATDGGLNPPPRRTPAEGGLNALPQRTPAEGGLNALPQRTPAEGGLNALPQRTPPGEPTEDALGPLPQRTSASDISEDALGPLPRRSSASPLAAGASEGSSVADPAADALGPLPRRTPAGEVLGPLPQRTPASDLAADMVGPLPRRSSSPDPLAGASGAMAEGSSVAGAGRDALDPLPQRTPVADEQAPSPQRQQRDTTDSGEFPPLGQAHLTRPEAARMLDATGKHRFRVAKTASFFRSRMDVPSAEEPAEETPIFAGMVSAWLSDPTTGEWALPQTWNDAADAGWSAAARANDAGVVTRTEVGLPQRSPGGRLVPGAARTAAKPDDSRPPRRDAEAIRANLSRHQRGVRDGRSARSSKNTDGER